MDLIGFDGLERSPIVDIGVLGILEKVGTQYYGWKAYFDIMAQIEWRPFYGGTFKRSKPEIFKDREYLYTSFPIQEQAKRGDWDYR